MAKIKIDRDRCKGCGLCVLWCPKKLILLEEALNARGVHPAVAKAGDACSGCCLCARMCPDMAIEVYK